MTSRSIVPSLAALLALGACQGAPQTTAGDGQTPGNLEDHRPYAGIAPTETVRLIGTEPFWGGSVQGDRLSYTTPDNQSGEVVTVARFAGRAGLSWSGTLSGAPFHLAVTEGECSDGMSDRRYPFTATLQVRGEQREGCAWSDRRGYSEPAEDGVQAPEPAASPAGAPIAAADLIRTEWRKAENHAECAPLGFAVKVAGTPRRANFGGGWAVAWDLPGRRSAFGVAGTGLTAGNTVDARDHRARLARQWPLFRELNQLPAPSFAGYGVEGAGDYPADNRGGVGLNSLAYVRVAGQQCDYNVWSRLGRADLERLLDALTPLPGR